MQFLESRFDRVIVDAPPHQGFADVLVLSQNVGGVVLAASMGEIKRAELRHFKKSVLNTRGTILGCIINKVDMTRRYGYQSYYKYYNYYNVDKLHCQELYENCFSRSRKKCGSYFDMSALFLTVN